MKGLLFRLWHMPRGRRNAALLARLEEECEENYHGNHRKADLQRLFALAGQIRGHADEIAFAEALESYAWTHQHAMKSKTTEGVLQFALALQTRLCGKGSAAVARLNYLLGVLPVWSVWSTPPDAQPVERRLRAVIENDDRRVDAESAFWAARAAIKLADLLDDTEPDTARQLRTEGRAHDFAQAEALANRAGFLWGTDSDPFRAYVWRYADAFLALLSDAEDAVPEGKGSEVLRLFHAVFADHPFPPPTSRPYDDGLWHYPATPPIRAEVEPRDISLPTRLSWDVYLSRRAKLDEHVGRLDEAEACLRNACDLLKEWPRETAHDLYYVQSLHAELLQFLTRHNRSDESERDRLAREIDLLEEAQEREWKRQRERKSLN